MILWLLNCIFYYDLWGYHSINLQMTSLINSNPIKHPSLALVSEISLPAFCVFNISHFKTSSAKLRKKKIPSALYPELIVFFPIISVILGFSFRYFYKIRNYNRNNCSVIITFLYLNFSSIFHSLNLHNQECIFLLIICKKYYQSSWIPISFFSIF